MNFILSIDLVGYIRYGVLALQLGVFGSNHLSESARHYW